MTAIKHAPWSYTKGDRNVYTSAPSHPVVAQAPKYCRVATDATWHEHAALIAAAPELLAALEMVMRRGRIDDSEEAMNQVAAAINKAKGLK